MLPWWLKWCYRGKDEGVSVGPRWPHGQGEGITLCPVLTQSEKVLIAGVWEIIIHLRMQTKCQIFLGWKISGEWSTLVKLQMLSFTLRSKVFWNNAWFLQTHPQSTWKVEHIADMVSFYPSVLAEGSRISQLHWSKNLEGIRCLFRGRILQGKLYTGEHCR